jgi:FkbM family methyltransferase
MLSFWKNLIPSMQGLTRIGSEYGGWTLPNKLLTQYSICYSVGAGEDLSFDVGLAEKYRCYVHIFDPTPRSKTHFYKLVSSIKNNRKMLINDSQKNHYQIRKHNIKLLKFNEIGLWDSACELKFYAPRNPNHVSHSILNLQQTTTFFIAKVQRLSALMKLNGHKELDLLKIDIEGAEYAVIESLIADKISIKILCVEFDEIRNPLDSNYKNRVIQSINNLKDYGYSVVHIHKNSDYTFVRNDIYN